MENTNGFNRRPVPKAGQRWRHFKGGLYEITCIAMDAADKSRRLVVYRAMHPPYETWVRPLDEFMSLVDAGRHPEHAGEYRFGFVQ